MSTLSATLTLEDACRSRWDVAVVGAGPSGSVVARQLAIAGVSVLLVDKARFPRRKVCGCYLNGSALETLERLGLDEIPTALHAPVVSGIRLGAQGREANLRLPPGRALSREAFDSALVQSAIAAGAEFLPSTEAKQLRHGKERHELTLVSRERRIVVETKLLVVADGVGGQLLRHHEAIQYRTTPRSLVGATPSPIRFRQNSEPTQFTWLWATRVTSVDCRWSTADWILPRRSTQFTCEVALQVNWSKKSQHPVAYRFPRWLL